MGSGEEIDEARRRYHVDDRDMPVPEGVRLTDACLSRYAVMPSAEEERRGAFRSDIQRALTSVRFVGGLFGPRGMVADSDVGARVSYEHFLSGFRRYPERREVVSAGGSGESLTFEIVHTPPQTWGACTPISDPSEVDGTAMRRCWGRLEEMIDKAEAEGDADDSMPTDE